MNNKRYNYRIVPPLLLFSGLCAGSMVLAVSLRKDALFLCAFLAVVAIAFLVSYRDCGFKVSEDSLGITTRMFVRKETYSFPWANIQRIYLEDGVSHRRVMLEINEGNASHIHAKLFEVQRGLKSFRELIKEIVEHSPHATVGEGIVEVIRDQEPQVHLSPITKKILSGKK